MPAFFCENCGKEVPPEVSSCPYCGEKFYSVRCPVCAFTGPARMFVKGCPSCGYQGAPSDAGTKKTLRNRREKRDLPRWLYVLFLFVLLGGLGVLVTLYVTL